MLGQQGGGGVVARAKVRTVKVKSYLILSYKINKINLILSWWPGPKYALSR